MSENGAVKIAVRERPAKDCLKENLQPSVVTYHPNGNNIIVNETLFTFDIALGPTVTQKEIFDKLIKPLIVNLKMGFNCTALAYGQTGAGKSYTMGLNSKLFDGDDAGVIPRCLEEIFSINVNSENQENHQTDKISQISVSFIEIYNEKVYDLLAENTNEPIAARGYKYTGGIRKPLNTLEDCHAILMKGNRNRHVRPTKMNSQSSRSHAIFTIHFLSTSQNLDGTETTIKSCMNIVDLAGSEGVRRTGHQGVAMSEGVHINQGLLSIGKVLQAMATRSKVIPYRDSVLSSVLQESLNSNSYLTLLACISPHREDLSETLSTLRFAQNAKQLKNYPEINNITADIKNNIKLKQTPYKLKSTLINNAATNILKRSCYTTIFGTQEKMVIKSNTFCTPKKQRVEVNKCNQTEIAGNCKRAKMSSNIAINLPKMNQLESTHNRESMFSRSSDSDGSLLSLNISTLTVAESDANKRNTNFTPIIRKCMTELKNDFEESLLTVFQKKLDILVPQTSAFASKQTVLSSPIRQELKSIMKEVLLEKNDNIFNNTEIKQNQQTTISSAKTSAKCQLLNNSDKEFKIPEIPLEFNGVKTSSPINKVKDSSASYIQTFFDNATNIHKASLNESIRRSHRLTENKKIEQSTMFLSDTALTNANQSLRRSSRNSVLQMYQNKRQSILLATHCESFQEQKIEGNVKKSKTISINNTIINGLTANKQIEQSTMFSSDTALTNANQSLRRSSRNSVLQMYQNKRQSILLATHCESLQEQKIEGNVKKSKKKCINNTIINGYCNDSLPTNKKTSLSKHRKAILDLLNKGSMRELQILPQVGQKTAYQIITQRTLHGKFKSLREVEKLPIWRGTAWERFAVANMLN